MAFIVTEGIFIAPGLPPPLQAVQHNSHGAGKLSEEDEEEPQTPRAENWRAEERFFLSVFAFYIQKLIAPLQQTGNPSDRKFDKSFSSLVSLYCSHYLPVVTSKLFFSYNCLILPFSITRKIYSSRPVTEFNFVEKKKIQERRERERCSSPSQGECSIKNIPYLKLTLSLISLYNSDETGNPTEG